MDENKEKSFTETVVEDVFNIVKFNKGAEVAFRNYYSAIASSNKATDRQLFDIFSYVTKTDFYKLPSNLQKNIAFSIGLFFNNNIVDSKVNAPSRNRATAFASSSFFDVLIGVYKFDVKSRDNNLKRIINVANCKDAKEIVSYLCTNLVRLIDRPFNVYWLACDLNKAETAPLDVTGQWVRKFFKEVSGKNKDKQEDK